MAENSLDTQRPLYDRLGMKENELLALKARLQNDKNLREAFNSFVKGKENALTKSMGFVGRTIKKAIILSTIFAGITGSAALASKLGAIDQIGWAPVRGVLNGLSDAGKAIFGPILEPVANALGAAGTWVADSKLGRWVNKNVFGLVASAPQVNPTA